MSATPLCESDTHIHKVSMQQEPTTAWCSSWWRVSMWAALKLSPDCWWFAFALVIWAAWPSCQALHTRIAQWLAILHSIDTLSCPCVEHIVHTMLIGCSCSVCYCQTASHIQLVPALASNLVCPPTIQGLPLTLCKKLPPL